MRTFLRGLFIFWMFLLAGTIWAGQDPLNLVYDLGEEGAAQPANWRIVLEFNAPVSLLDLSKKLTFKVNGKEKVFSVINATDTFSEVLAQPLPVERTSFVIGSKEETLIGATCTLNLAKGLKSADGKLEMSAGVDIAFSTIDFVTFSNPEPFYQGADQKGIRFDLVKVGDESKKPLEQNVPAGVRQIKEGDLKKKLRILPPVGKFNLSISKNTSRFTVTVKGAFKSGQKYSVLSSGGLLGDSGFGMKKGSISATAKGADPEIRFLADRSVLELNSRQTVPVMITGVEKARCELTRIPAIFAAEFSSLSLLAKNDARRPRTSEALEGNTSDESEIASNAKIIDQVMVEDVRKLDALAAIASETLNKGINLSWFLGDFAHSAEVFCQSIQPDKNYRLALPLNFRPLPANGGVILARLCDSENPAAANVSRVLQITDLGITYKFSEKSLLLWVTSIETGKPVPGAEILLFQASNTILMPGKADKDGVLLIKTGAKYPAIDMQASVLALSEAVVKVDDVVWAMTATEKDSAFIELESNRFRPWQIAQEKASKVSLKTRNAHVFTERGVYKPGETVFWKATIRKYDNHAVVAPASETVAVEIRNSRDDVLSEEEYTLNEFGTCSGSLDLTNFSPLGQYSVRVLSEKTKAGEGKKKSDESDSESEEEGSSSNNPSVLTETGFQVQHFEKPRHFVTIKNEKKSREDTSIAGRKLTQDYLEVKIEGKYYTGGPVKMAKVRWTAYLLETGSDVKGYETYHFGGGGEDRTLIESGEAILDKDGALSVQLPIDKNLMNGLNGIELSATVLDVDGRPATDVETYVPPVPFRVGINRLGGKIMEGDQATIELLVVDDKGNPVPSGEVRLEILKKRGFYTQKRDENGNMFYRWEHGWLKTIGSDRQLKEGKAAVDLAFDDSGSYQLQAVFVHEGAEYVSRLPLDVGYVYDNEEDSGRQRSRSPNQIMMSCSRAEAAVGENVRADFTVVRAASHALVTCEREDLLEYKVITLNGRHGTFEMPMKAEGRPNVYLMAIVPCSRGAFPVYKSQVDAGLPNVYYGIAAVKVKDTVKTLSVAIQPDQPNLTGRPAEQKKMDLVVTNQDGSGANCEMAVCVVDEAILSLTGYVTPILTRLNDFSLPLSTFSGDLRLSLITQELYKLFATKALTGGDMGSGGLASDLALRKDFRPVAYWNPALMTDAAGKASFEFKLPDSTTAYRIYVVALNKTDAYCSAERQMIVTKEFYVQPGLPRFLIAGDKAVFPVSLINKSSNAGPAELKVAEAKNLMLKLSEPAPQMTALNDTVVKTTIEADNGAGEGSVTLTGRFGTFGDAIQLPLTIYSRFMPVNRTLFGHFKGKTTVEATFPSGVSGLSSKDLKGALKASLALSTTEWGRLVPALRYLLRYPYGCIEQTSSGIIPLAGLRKLVGEGLLPGITIENVDKFLKPGVERLFGMQTDSGGFGYWPGDREPSYWGTLYALFALSMAKDAGCDVSAEKLTDALKYVSKNLFGKDKKGENYHHYGIDELAAVNLAMNKYLTKENLELLMKNYDACSLEGKAYLLWADSILGVTPAPKLREMLKKLNPKFETARSYWYDSSTREFGATLLAGMNIDAASKKNDDLAGTLLKELKSEGRWYSTADTGLCLLALAKYFQKSAVPSESDLKVKVLQPGKDPVEVTVGRIGKEIELDAENLLKTPSFEIQGDESHLVNWTLNYSYPDMASRADELDNGFYLVKDIKNLNGEKEIHVGDILKVSLEFEDYLHKTGKYGNFEYLAIEDPLPGGFIAINSALKSDRRPASDDEETSADDDEYYSDWEDGAYKLRPDHFEMRDDRVLAFKNRLWSGRHRLAYFVRAVCEGEFWLRPSRISLMYDPEKFGLTQGEMIRVLPAK